MRLYIAAAVGRGSTELSAFDDALIDAGIANFNLIRLSSVIPPHSDIVRVPTCPFGESGGWGDRLYVVYADQRTSEPGQQAWAGIGWTQDQITGRGLFVEHEGHSEDEVRCQIAASLEDLYEHRGLAHDSFETCVIGSMCSGSPTCAFVVCAFAVEPWAAQTREASEGDPR